MTDDEILEDAKKVGYDWLFPSMPLEKLERFAAIIEKRTIERCAEVCDGFANSHNDQQMIAAMNCAAAIRAME